MKKRQTPQDVYNKGMDQTVQSDACLYPARHVLLILTCKLMITKHLINCISSFSAALLSGDKRELTQIFDLLICR